MIVAVDQKMAIGNRGDQLAYISDDLKHFKATTLGHTVIMGRKTSEALPKGVLPKRRNVVVTRSKTWRCDGAELAQSIDEAIEMTQNDGEVFVMGGGEIYRAFMPKADKLYVTHIEHTFDEADTFFPEISEAVWQRETESEVMTDEKTGLHFYFATYVKR